MIPCTAISLATSYIYGAYCDYKYRKIPNVVPIIILITGILAVFFISPQSMLYVPIFDRILAAVLIGLTAIIIPSKDIGGGDFKLMIATGFFFGTLGLSLILVFTLIAAKSLSRVLNTGVTRMPMGFYMVFGLVIYIVILVSLS